MTGKQMLMKTMHYEFAVEEGFKQWDRTAKGKRRAFFKRRIKKASRKLRRDKSFLKEINE